MADLKTLRDITGLGNAPGSLSDAALIMMDCQNTYRQGMMQQRAMKMRLRSAAFVGYGAQSKVSIFHIQYDAGTGSPYDISDDIGAISSEVMARTGEPVIVNNLPNAFVQTELDEQIKSAGVQNVILAGFMIIWASIAQRAGPSMLALPPTIVASATATTSLPGPRGETILAQAVPIAVLVAVNDLFAVVVDSADDLQR
jgi:Isochorismatase family